MASIFNQSLTKRLDEYLISSKKKSYFVAAITVVFVLIIFLFGVRPAVTSSIRQYNDNKERTAVIESLELKLATLKDLTEQQELYADALEYFDFILPSSDRNDYIIKDIYKYINANNINISSFQWTSDEDQYEQLSNYTVEPPVVSRLVNIQGSAEIEDLINFLTVLENSRRIYNIRSINIFPVNQENLALFEELKPFTFNLEIQYFYWDEGIAIL